MCNIVRAPSCFQKINIFEMNKFMHGMDETARNVCTESLRDRLCGSVYTVGVDGALYLLYVMLIQWSPSPFACTVSSLQDNSTPLHHAARRGSTAVCDLFITNEANVNARGYVSDCVMVNGERRGEGRGGGAMGGYFIMG